MRQKTREDTQGSTRHKTPYFHLQWVIQVKHRNLQRLWKRGIIPMMHMAQWDLSIFHGNTPDSLGIFPNAHETFFTGNPKYTMIPKLMQRMTWDVSCYSMVPACQKRQQKPASGVAAGVTCLNQPLKPKAPILLQPQVSVGSAQATVLTVEKTSLGRIPHPSVLLMCGHELLNQTCSGKSQPQHCTSREHEVKH